MAFHISTAATGRIAKLALGAVLASTMTACAAVSRIHTDSGYNYGYQDVRLSDKDPAAVHLGAAATSVAMPIPVVTEVVQTVTALAPAPVAAPQYVPGVSFPTGPTAVCHSISNPGAQPVQIAMYQLGVASYSAMPVVSGMGGPMTPVVATSALNGRQAVSLGHGQFVADLTTVGGQPGGLYLCNVNGDLVIEHADTDCCETQIMLNPRPQTRPIYTKAGAVDVSQPQPAPQSAIVTFDTPVELTGSTVYLVEPQAGYAMAPQMVAQQPMFAPQPMYVPQPMYPVVPAGGYANFPSPFMR